MFLSLSWVKQLSWPQNPQRFFPIDPRWHTFGSLVLRRVQSIWLPTWFHILLSVIPSPQNKQEILSLLVSFCWVIRHSGRFSTKSVSLLLWSWYGNESGLFIIGRSSTFPIIFSVSGSSDSQRELIDPLIPILMTWMHRSQVTKWFLGQLQRWVEFHHYWRRKWQVLLQDLVGQAFLIVFRCM